MNNTNLMNLELVIRQSGRKYLLQVQKHVRKIYEEKADIYENLSRAQDCKKTLAKHPE